MDFGNLDINPRYKDKNAWPHNFIKQGGLVTGDDGLPVQPHICIHCHIEWKMGQHPRPIGICPARNDRDELKRILG